MADVQAQLEKPFKMINVTITTIDPLTAEVLRSAKRVKRLNAVLGMMLEAYLATPEGRVTAAQQLRVPLPDLLDQVGHLAALAPAEAAHATPAAEAAAPVVPARTAAKSIKFDNLIA